MPDPVNQPKEPVPRDAVWEALRRYQFFWYSMLSLPIVYLLICLGIRQWWFGPDQHGAIEPSPRTAKTILYGFGVLALMAQVAMLVLRQTYAVRLQGAQRDNRHLIQLLWKRLVFQGLFCDTVSLLGLVYYILTGDLLGMFIFGVVSYLLYAQIQPRDHFIRALLGE